MLEVIFSYIFGFLSIFSPCILPIVPIILASSGDDVKKSLLMIFGLTAGTFTLLSFSALLIYLSNLAYIFLLFFAAVLLSERLELFLSSKFKIRFFETPSQFLNGFFLTFIWLPCTFPFLGSAAVQMVHNHFVAISYLLGMISSIAILVKVGGRYVKKYGVVKKIAAVIIILYLIYSL